MPVMILVSTGVRPAACALPLPFRSTAFQGLALSALPAHFGCLGQRGLVGDGGGDPALIFFPHAGQLFPDAGCDHQPGAQGSVYCVVDSVCTATAALAVSGVLSQPLRSLGSARSRILFLGTRIKKLIEVNLTSACIRSVSPAQSAGSPQRTPGLSPEDTHGEPHAVLSASPISDAPPFLNRSRRPATVMKRPC